MRVYFAFGGKPLGESSYRTRLLSFGSENFGRKEYFRRLDFNCACFYFRTQIELETQPFVLVEPVFTKFFLQSVLKKINGIFQVFQSLRVLCTPFSKTRHLSYLLIPKSKNLFDIIQSIYGSF